MNLNNLLQQGINPQLPDDTPIKRKQTRMIYSDEYLSHETNVPKTEVRHTLLKSGEEVEEYIITRLRLGCGHFLDDKNLAIIEIREKPINRDQALNDFFKKHGYILVCQNCAKKCTHCGKHGSIETLKLKPEGYFCKPCDKKLFWEAFWAGLKDFFVRVNNFQEKNW